MHKNYLFSMTVAVPSTVYDFIARLLRKYFDYMETMIAMIFKLGLENWNNNFKNL